jgi:hypothetical protein
MSNPQGADYATLAQSLVSAVNHKPDIPPDLHHQIMILQCFDSVAEKEMETTIYRLGTWLD